MRRQFLTPLYLILLLPILAWSQIPQSPYPILFVHGLTGSDETFLPTMQILQEAYYTDIDDIYVYDVILNADDDQGSALLWDDVRWSDWDYNNDDINVGRRTWAAENDDMEDGWSDENASIFAVNFKEERVRGAAGFFNDYFDQSNGSAIYKQGYALRAAIAEIINFTQKDKVILVGHSMGGLAIREYLQRTVDGTPDSEHLWWVESQDSLAGHHIARVVTTGTPHFGSNIVEVMAGRENVRSIIPDLYSEAVRDLRYEFNSITSEMPGVYLFGGLESDIADYSTFYNYDVNCDGDELDAIVGISQDSTFNPQQPLPLNLEYTWITSNWTGSGDGVVDLGRQWLHSGDISTPQYYADTLLVGLFHTYEGGDFRSILRGLDEPDSSDCAYELIPDGTNYFGFTTYQPGYQALDTDWYKFTASVDGFATINLELYQPTTTWALEIIEASTGQSLLTTDHETSSLRDGLTIPVNLNETYFLYLTAEAYELSYQMPYVISVENHTLGSARVAAFMFSGDSEDQSEYGYNAQAMGGCIYVEDRFGNATSAISLDGVDDYLFTENAAHLSLEEYTLTAWFESSAPVSDGCILAFGESSNGDIMGYSIWNTIRTGDDYGKIETSYETSDDTDVILNGLYTPSNAAWHFVAVTRSGDGRLDLYLDGDLFNSMSQTGMPPYIDHFLSIGARTNSGGDIQDFYSGILDDIQIFGRALDAVELDSLFVIGGWRTSAIYPELPDVYELNQNFPNPFNPITTISYSLPERSMVKLTIFDIQGREITNLQKVEKPQGKYEVQWSGMDESGNSVSTGVYFCRLQAGEYSQTIKMVYLR